MDRCFETVDVARANNSGIWQTHHPPFRSLWRLTEKVNLRFVEDFRLLHGFAQSG
jgi:hypothetical protein